MAENGSVLYRPHMPERIRNSGIALPPFVALPRDAFTFLLDMPLDGSLPQRFFAFDDPLGERAVELNELDFGVPSYTLTTRGQATLLDSVDIASHDSTDFGEQTASFRALLVEGGEGDAALVDRERGSMGNMPLEAGTFLVAAATVDLTVSRNPATTEPLRFRYLVDSMVGRREPVWTPRG